ncbi:unnamed protein product [Mytilus edulis]|uniref:Uncharacterized protein n=1 Tax=Mytilus edulis TaxID=6550 RepID=A0A8S3UYL4_MYTED|nr:unnamed protein product [Mytilus edulis]
MFEKEDTCRLSRETTEALSVSHIDTTNSRLEIGPEIEVLSTEILQNCDLPGSTTSRSEAEIQGELFPSPLSNEKTNADHATLIEHVYEKSEEHMDIHLTVTYAIMWGVALVMWTPYVIVCYLDAYASFSMWGGWYSMVVPITHMTYVMKPIIYLSHNKVFKDAAYQTIPESVRTRSQKVRKVFKKSMNKMDDFVFPQRKRSIGIEESDNKKPVKNETFSTFKTTKSKRNSETRF